MYSDPNPPRHVYRAKKKSKTNKAVFPRRSAHDAWASIASIADVLQPKSSNRADFLKECQSGAFDGVSVAYRTFDSVAITGKIDSEVLNHMPKSLKFLCHNGKDSLPQPERLLLF